MPFLTKGDTNWKFIGIVAVLAVIVGGGILLCIKTQESLLINVFDLDKSKKTEIEEIYIGEIKIDYDGIAEIQKAVDEGHQPWRLDPESVVMNESIKYGFISDDFGTMQQILLSVTNGVAEYEITHNDKVYVIVLNQPIIGEDKIWVISEIKQRESAWNIYRNEEYGFEFDYPSNWGELTLESKKNDNYNFNSSNKAIIEIKYYKPRGVLAFITKGTIHREADESVKITPEEGFEVCDYVLKVIHQNGQIKTIYTEENKPREDNDKIIYPYAGGKKIGGISFQPNEKYIRLGWSAYANYGSYLLNMNTGKDILASYPIWNGDIYWSPDNKVLAVKSHINEYGGDGVEGLFVSDYGNPEKLKEVFSIPHEQYSKGIRISVIGFIDSEHLSFEIFEIEEKLQEYTYNIKTKELKKTE